MKKYLLDTSYAEVTLKSAQQGEFADEGMLTENVEYDSLYDMAKVIRREVVEASDSPDVNRHTSYCVLDPEVDDTTGSETYYNFHPVNLTDEEAVELNRLIMMPKEAFVRIGGAA